MSSTDGPAIVGIDLGTTMSAAAIYQDRQVVFIENGLGETLTPSAVAFDTRSRGLVVGRTAKDLLATNPELGAVQFKRSMGSDDGYTLNGNPYSAIELSAYVLDALRSDTERQLGRSVTQCVVTVPAYFNEAQRHATKQAAELAGFYVERILNEPTAAAIAYGLHAGEEEAQFVVLDLGGGTFDVCVMERFEGLLEVKSVAGASQLGGEDFTSALRDLCLRVAGVKPEKLDVQAQTVLLRRAELLKRKLSTWPSAEIEVPTGAMGPDSRGGATRITITANDADIAFKPLLDRIVAPCRNAVRDSEFTLDDITDVILVGGATRMPSIARLASELFGVEVKIQQDPDHIVAKGAAVQAALCARDEGLEDMIVTDVASHSLGTSTSREIMGKRTYGHFAPLIDRNTVIPVSRHEQYGTVDPGQTRITFDIYEGESRKVEQNRKIGEVVLDNIAKGLPRTVADVRFTYDLNGLLEVEVTSLETGEKVSKVFQRGEQALSGAQLERAVEKLSRLKVDPQERPRHRDLIARAEALYSEVSDLQRQQLEAALNHFEVALDQRQPDVIEEVFQLLTQVCDGIDAGERW